MAESRDGSGIYILSATVTSPTLARQWRAVQAAWPKLKLAQYDPAIAGTAAASGPNLQYDLAEADVILSLDADFLSGAAFPGFHRLAREYAARRKEPEKGMNRLYAVESMPTTTGLKADHRLGLRASEIPAFAAELARAVGVEGINSGRRGQGFAGARGPERGDPRALSGRIGDGAGPGHQQCSG